MPGEEERRLQENIRFHGAAARGETMGPDGYGYPGAISNVKEKEQIHHRCGRLCHKVGGGRGLAAVLPVAGAAEVADFFVHEILLRLDMTTPRNSTTDQGKCFVARMMQQVLRVLQTNHRTTTAYHPQGNGQLVDG